MVMRMEIWKVIAGFERYSVSSKGRIKNNKTGRLITPWVNSNSYKYVDLYNANGKRKFRVNRLVANHFVAKVPGANEVHHIDENRLNNSADNLQWVTRFENVNSGNHNDKVSSTLGTHVLVIELSTNTKHEYSSITRAMTEFPWVSKALKTRKPKQGYEVKTIN